MIDPAIRAIINADDLGISREVNDAIFDLMARRRISSATLLANGPDVANAAARLGQFPHCSFGVHLNLTQFEPLSHLGDANPLLNDAGVMSRQIEQARPTVPLIRAAYTELCAQVDRLVALGVPISHVDSHHHVHTQPHVFPALKALQRRFGIRRVRLSKNLYASDQPCPMALQWKKRAYNVALRSIYRTKTTDTFTELTTYMRVASAGKARYRSIELMVHPGADNAAAETAILDSDWLAREQPPLELVTYNQL